MGVADGITAQPVLRTVVTDLAIMSDSLVWMTRTGTLPASGEVSGAALSIASTRLFYASVGYGRKDRNLRIPPWVPVGAPRRLPAPCTAPRPNSPLSRFQSVTTEPKAHVKEGVSR